MHKFREIINNTDENLKSSFELDTLTRENLIKSMHGEGLSNSKDNIWEKIVVAGELSLVGIDVKNELSVPEKESFKKELSDLREKLKESGDDLDYIDLARCVYRFKNIGLDFDDLTEDEIRHIEELPEIFRKNSQLHGHLNYLPQVTLSIEGDLGRIAGENDFVLARQAIESDLRANSGSDKELEIMVFAGLLVETNEQEAEKLINSNFWPKERWSDVVEMMNNLKKSEKDNSAYMLARLLPQFLKMRKFIEGHKK